MACQSPTSDQRRMIARPAYVSAFAVALLFGALGLVRAQDVPKPQGYITFTKEEATALARRLQERLDRILVLERELATARAQSGCI